MKSAFKSHSVCTLIWSQHFLILKYGKTTIKSGSSASGCSSGVKAPVSEVNEMSFRGRSHFNPAFLQLCEPDSVKSSILSHQIHAVTSANQICLLTVPWREQMSYYQLAHTSPLPYWCRGLKYPPLSQDTLSSWCTSCRPNAADACYLQKHWKGHLAHTN